MKKFIAVLGTVLLSSTLALTPANAAEPQSLSPEIEAEYLSVFKDKGIDSSHWDGLLEKIASGEILDADNPSNVEPLSTTSITENGVVKNRSVYPDGTVADFYETGASDGLVARGSTVGSCTTNGYEKNCRVVYDGISWSYSFRAVFYPSSSTAKKAMITAARGATIHRSIGHSVSDVSVKIMKSTQSGDTPAQARMQFLATATAVGITITSRTIRLDLKVASGIATASTNL